MSIGRFFHNIAHPFVALFGKVFGEDVRHNFAVAAEALLKSALGKIVEPIVNELEQLAVDGVTKHNIAFGKIVDAAKAAGLSFSNSIVNLLIEIAVQKLKGNANA